jgi:hypothetical protein
MHGVLVASAPRTSFACWWEDGRTIPSADMLLFRESYLRDAIKNLALTGIACRRFIKIGTTRRLVEAR